MDEGNSSKLDLAVLDVMSKRILSKKTYFQRKNFNFAMFGLSFISIFILLLPVLMGYHLHDDCYGDECSTLFTSFASSEFHHSVIASLAVASLLSIEFALDAFSTFNFFHSGCTQKGALLLSLLIPNTLILAVVIPDRNADLLVCILNIRNVLISFAVLKHLHEYGSPIFSMRTTISLLVFFIAGHVLICFSAFTSTDFSKYLFYSSQACFLIEFIFIGIAIARWLRFFIKSYLRSVNSLSTADLNCITFLLPTTAYLLLSIIIREVKSEGYLMFSTYIHLVFTATVFSAQSRLNRVQMTKNREVIELKFRT